MAGFIDSIAGGGGLMTVPAFSILLGPSALAIGTNKIAGSAAAGMAFLIYARNGQFSMQKGLYFSLAVLVGSFLGSQIGSVIPAQFFQWLMLAVCPLMLVLVLKKDMIVKEIAPHNPKTKVIHLQRLLLAGFLCGLYDGVLGPGGGTLMLMALLLMTEMPLLLAIGISKFANLLSALSSLSGYALHSNVDWSVGLYYAGFATVGALVGSKLATKKAATIVRPVLVLVVTLLFIKLVSDLF